MSDTPKATPGVCANRMYASIGGRCCAHCGQQIHHNGNDGWRHIATKQAACAMEREAVADPNTEQRKRDSDELDRLHGGAA